MSVADAIEMTRLWTNEYAGANTPAKDVAQFSPDEKQVLVLVKRGNLQKNTTEYSLLLWRTDEIFSSSHPETLLTLSSSSNREAIKNVKWFEDSESVAFLGEEPGKLTQVYAINIKTHTFEKITNHSTNVISYSLTHRRDHVAYLAEHPKESIWNDETGRKGIWIENHRLPNLIRGDAERNQKGLFYLSLKRGGPPKRLGVMLTPYAGPISLSPDGKHIVLFDSFTELVPASWKEYRDPVIKKHLNDRHGEYTPFQRYVLIDTSEGQTRTLLNSPIVPEPLDSEAIWSADSTSVIITNTYLPLEGLSDRERNERISVPFTFEVNIATGNITTIAHGSGLIEKWNQKTNQLVLRSNDLPHSPIGETVASFKKQGGRWKRVQGDSENRSALEIVLEEDMNTPPRILAKDPRTHRNILLLDLNPQFKDRKFGTVKEVEWKTTEGQTEKGRLYYPVNYVTGSRYPIVVQTHAYNQPYRFEIDGPFTTAFAAQPLAGKGIMVLETQIHHTPGEETPREIDEAISVYEGAIRYLDDSGLIDVNRIGIIGFSRTCLHVKAALTSSKYHFAAASVTDGVDGGYFQYIASNTPQAWEHFNGGPPFGDGVKLWLQHSPSFRIGNVQTPLLITSLNSFSVLAEWEWFAALRRLGKPVDMVYIHEGSHVLERPWDRMVSQQGNVDWFAFWLKGEEDPDPGKTEQYARWRKLQKLREANQSPSQQ